jgi:shikimate kinase
MKPAFTKTIFLTGVKHSGKTTLGKLLAEILNVEFIDIDGVIEKQTCMTAREVFAQKGEAGFRDAELGACESVCRELASGGKTAVIAAGGGLCDNPPALALVRETGFVVYLDVPEKTIMERILKKTSRAPDGTMLGLPAYIAQHNPRSEEEAARLFRPVFEKRSARYAEIADAVFAPGISAERNARELAAVLRADTAISSI